MFSSGKISFGFNKTSKKVEKHEPVQEAKQLIDCLEGQSIKIIGVNEDDNVEKPLVIPVKPSREILPTKPFNPEFDDIADPNAVSKTLADANTSKNGAVAGQVSLEVLAANEIIAELNKTNTNEDENKVVAIPIYKETPLGEGHKESTSEDYENIPITAFGLAMLRGMGWTPPAKTKSDVPVHLDVPIPRPKGMGLGADRPSKGVAHGKVSKKYNQKEEDLKIIVGGCVKIVMGKSANSYGKIEGFDDDSGRIIIKLAIGDALISLNEFMVEPVSKTEYNEKSKVINSAKYDEYKNRELNKYQDNGETHSSKEEETKKVNNSNTKYEQSRQISKKGNSRSNSRSSDVYVMKEKDPTISIDSSDEGEGRYKNKERRKSIDRDRKSRKDNDRYSSRKKDKKTSHHSRDVSLSPSRNRKDRRDRSYSSSPLRNKRDKDIKYRRDRSESPNYRRDRSDSPNYRRRTGKSSDSKRDRTEKYKKESRASPDSSYRKKDKKHRKHRSVSSDSKEGNRYKNEFKEQNSKSHKKKSKRRSRSGSRK